jgi:hypothetical protein
MLNDRNGEVPRLMMTMIGIVGGGGGGGGDFTHEWHLLGEGGQRPLYHAGLDDIQALK